MQLEDARGLQRCQAFLQSAEVSICRALLQHITQLALPIDQSLEEDVVALFRIEPLRPLALKAIAVIKPTRVIDHLVPLIAGGDEGVHQALGTMLRRRELAAQPAARALLAGLDDPQWARERLWVLEMLERLVQPA